MSEWPVVPLGAVVTLINGDRGKNYPRAEDRVNEGIPFINAGHLTGGRVRMEGMDFIKPEHHRVLRSGHVQAGDVLLCIRGSLGRAALVAPGDSPGAIASSLVILRPTAEILPRFLLAYLNGPIGSQLIASGDNGVAQPNIGAASVARFGVPLPPIATQDKIVSVLSALDDLIENTRRRIEVLEEMAQAIYREWFVHFRFPGHEYATFVDSPLGPIPDGWDVRKASDAMAINPRTKSLKEVEDPFVTMGDISERSLVCFPSEMKDGTSGSKFLNGDTLFARITPCLENGKTGYVAALEEGQVGRGSTEFIVLRGSLVGSAFTYFLARDPDFRGHAIASMSGASGRQRVRNECFDSYELAVPTGDIIDSFERLATSMMAQAFSLARQNQSLMKVRDLLLPKLVTGEIDISQLDLGVLVEVVS